MRITRVVLTVWIGATIPAALHGQAGSMAASAAATEDIPPLDVARFVSISLDGDELCETRLDVAHAGSSSCATLKRGGTIGTKGALRIRFDQRALLAAVDEGDPLQISVRGHVIDADGNRRNIEIPGYSQVGAQTTYRRVDVAAALAALQLIEQGVRFAHRARAYRDKASIVALRAEAAAASGHAKRLELQLDEVVRTLADVYHGAHTYTLLAADVEAAAKRLAAARAAVGDLAAARESARAKGPETFFGLLNAELAGITAWLSQLSKAGNGELLELTGVQVNRPVSVITANVAAMAAAIERYQADELTPQGRVQLLQLIDQLAHHMVELEEDVFFRVAHDPCFASTRGGSVTYANGSSGNGHGNPVGAAAACGTEVNPSMAANILRHLPDRTAGIVRPATRIARAVEKAWPTRAHSGIAACQAAPPASTPPNPTDWPARFRTALRDRLPGRDVPPTSAELAHEFELTSKSIADLRVQAGKLSAQADSVTCHLALVAKAIADGAAGDAVVNKTVESWLLAEMLGKLARRVQPATIQIEDLDVEPGDRVVIEVASAPPPTEGASPAGMRPYSFPVVKRGFSGALPKIVDSSFFVRPTGVNEVPGVELDFDFRPGALAVWNFYGESAFWRTIAPGVGINLSYLDFSTRTRTAADSITETDDDSFQLGLGGVVTLFDNVLSFSYGWNLSRKEIVIDAANGANTRSEGRRYFGVGVSLVGVIEKLQGGGGTN